MAGADPADPLGHVFPDPAPDFTGGFSKDALKGVRIGVWRGYSGAGVDERVEDILQQTIVTLMALGADIVDPVVIDTEGMSAAQHEVLYYEFKTDLNAYLEKSGAPIKSLAGLIEFNQTHADTVMPIFGQEDFIEAQGKGPLTDQTYLDALAAAKRISQNGINQAPRCPDRADAGACVADRPYQRRHVDGHRKFVAGRDCRVPEHYRSGGPCRRPADRRFLHGRRIQRC